MSFSDFYDSKSRIKLLGEDVLQTLCPLPRREKNSARTDGVRWLPLPFHFLWQYSNLGSRLKKFIVEHSSCYGFGVTCTSVRPAWKVSGNRTIAMVNGAIDRASLGAR